MIAKGTFDVTLHPEPPVRRRGWRHAGARHIDKTFTSGPLEATSVVDMIGARTKVPSSAGYVAIERVRGSLSGKRGSFVMQHSGTMQGGSMSLVITIVPDSGTGELAGILGKMAIEIVEGKHFYELDYELR